LVRYERTGAAALVTIDRPERRNAVDGPTAGALLGAFERFAEDGDARVLVLTGAGDAAFCAGADLKALPTLDLDAPGGPLGFTRLASPKPTIAAVGGWCLAGGFELALWCDLRVAADTATFGCAERRWGVPLMDGGTQRLARIVGQGRALDLVLTGRMVGAAEAHAIGLVTEVVPPGRHVERALEMAEGLAAFPQETMLSDRRALLEGLGRPLSEGLDLEDRLGREVLAVALAGADRFAGGQGRGGGGTGV
jgi:enoyl-CoA hydratase